MPGSDRRSSRPESWDRRAAGDGSRSRVSPGPVATIVVELYESGAAIDVLTVLERHHVASLMEGAARALRDKAKSIRRGV